MSASPYMTEERVAIRDRARSFAMAEVLPVAAVCDPQRADIPDELIAKLAAEGYFGIRVDREHGGLGLGVFEYALITEELGRAWMSVAGLIARGNGLGTSVADERRSGELLRRSAAGSWIGAVALSERGAGSDLANVQCRAVRDGDGWLITGEKRWCGNVVRADFIVLMARVEDPVEGQHRGAGLSLFLIEKPAGTLPAGLEATPIEKIGYHGITTYALRLDEVRVPGGSELAENGLADILGGLNSARVHTAARAVGLARAALEDSIAYLNQRQQFGRPLAAFQALRFSIADMAADVEAGRALTYQAAHACDTGDPATATHCSIAKLWASEMAVRVTSQAMQLHGGNGYTPELAVERHWRDARLTTIFEGTSEIQRTIIADDLLGGRRR